MVSRREFLATAAALQSARAMPVNDAITPKARPFPMKQVRLLDGLCFYLMERDRGYLHSLEFDRLLHNFRVNAGFASSAEPLAGWERPDIELRGHFTGHYLSACALMFASSRDEQIKTKADRMVTELAKCQKALGEGYLSAFPKEFFDRLRDHLPVWAPWYTVHKIMAGMLDIHLQCGNQQALDVLEGMAGWTSRWAGQLNDGELARTLEREYGGMNDLLYNLYAVTGKTSYRDLAHRFDQERLFAPLAERRDELKGQHVNTTIPKIIGAARRHELTGEARYRTIAEYFWRQVTGHRAYCTGGLSNYERWRTDPDQLADELSNKTQECCCTYNMLKLTRHIFAWTADAACGDYYERAFFNGILGTMNPENAMTMYYVPLESGYWKMFSTPRASFWCCTGTGVENFAKLADSIYFHDDDGVYVNLFVPSRVEWPEKGVRIRQETDFPEHEKTAFEIQSDKPVRLTLRVRVPYWATRGVTARLNGKPLEASARPSSFLAVDRTWTNGDRLEVDLPMSLHVHAMPDDPTLQSIMYGPLVLAGRLGTALLNWEMQYGDPLNARGGKFLRGDVVHAPEFTVDSADPNTWIKPVAGKPLTFQTAGQSHNVQLIPLHTLFGERYAVYFRVKRS